MMSRVCKRYYKRLRNFAKLAPLLQSASYPNTWRIMHERNHPIPAPHLVRFASSPPVNVYMKGNGEV